MSALLATSALVAVAALLPGAARAQNATWLASPSNGDFNGGNNWSPNTPPTGTAFFGTSSITGLSFSSSTTFIGGWTFNPGASNYTFANGSVIEFTGAGIVINGGSASITNSSLLEFLNSSTAGSASITNSSILKFLNSSTAGSASITNSSILEFLNSSTAGSAIITTNSGGRIIMSNSASGGTARFIINGTGFVDISGANVGTTAGSIEGDGAFGLGSKNLAVGGNNLSTTFSGVIQNSGSLTKAGTGTLTLSGTNTYTGATTVDAGTLAVNGSISTSSGVTVNNGGTLAGTGTVSTTTITSGGTLAAGNGAAGSSLSVAGSLALQSGAFYMVQINPTTSSFATVTGTATLAGSTVKATYASGSYVAKQYTILTAGSISGTFGSVAETNLPSNFHSTLSYDATHAYLNLVLSFVPPTGSGLNGLSGLSGNQQKVGNALINYFNSNGGIPLVYSTLTATGLTQASGETASRSQQTTFQAMTQFMGVMTDPVSAGRGDAAGTAGAPNAYAEESRAYADEGQRRSHSEREAYAMLTKAPLAKTYDPRWSVWVSGFGGSQQTDGSAAAGSNNSTSSIYGTAVGADYRISPNTIAGFALAGGGTNFGVAGSGSGRSDLFQAGAFVRHTIGAAYLSGALAYGWQDVTTDRTVTIAGVDRLRAEFNANTWSGRVEGGYRYVTPWMGGIGLTPYAAGQFTTFDLPAYAESVVSGANTFALAYGSRSATDTRSELGIRTDKSFAIQDGILTLRGRFAWAHDFNSDRSIAATFQALPGANFVVNGAAQASESALTTASIERKWMNGWSTAATFEGEFSEVTRSYAGKGVVRYAW